MTSTAAPRLTRRHVRDLQRIAHLLAGAVLLAYIYASSFLGAGFTATVQWVLAPMIVGSGIALWKWPQIHTILRGRQ